MEPRTFKKKENRPEGLRAVSKIIKISFLII